MSLLSLLSLLNELQACKGQLGLQLVGSAHRAHGERTAQLEAHLSHEANLWTLTHPFWQLNSLGVADRINCSQVTSSETPVRANIWHFSVCGAESQRQGRTPGTFSLLLTCLSEESMTERAAGGHVPDRGRGRGRVGHTAFFVLHPTQNAITRLTMPRHIASVAAKPTNRQR